MSKAQEEKEWQQVSKYLLNSEYIDPETGKAYELVTQEEVDTADNYAERRNLLMVAELRRSVMEMNTVEARKFRGDKDSLRELLDVKEVADALYMSIAQKAQKKKGALKPRTAAPASAATASDAAGSPAASASARVPPPTDASTATKTLNTLRLGERRYEDSSVGEKCSPDKGETDRKYRCYVQEYKPRAGAQALKTCGRPNVWELFKQAYGDQIQKKEMFEAFNEFKEEYDFTKSSDKKPLKGDGMKRLCQGGPDLWQDIEKFKKQFPYPPVE